jgi:hypothetical protein
MATDERMVPKVHPLTRSVEPEDPMELVATSVQGDSDFLLECLVQEYAWLGCGAEEIVALFHDPAYPALNALVGLYGEPGLRERVASLVRQTGVLHVSGRVIDEPDPDDDDRGDLIQLTVRKVSAD